MPVDNRNFIFIDEDDEDVNKLHPEEDDDDDEDFDVDEDDDEDESPDINNRRNTSRPIYGNSPWTPQTPRPTVPPTTTYPPSNPYQQPKPWTFSPFGTSYRPNIQQPGFNNYQTQYGGRTEQRQGYQQSNENRIDRKKKIIFCDLIDILIESESAVREQNGTYLSGSNNYKRIGVMPRGLYDVRLKLEVWSKLAAFGADYIFCITNQPEKSKEDMETWKVMTDYVMYALADYLQMPHSNCRCLTKLGFNRQDPSVKPGDGLIKKALQTIPGYRYKRKDLVVIGANSGYQNQSNIDYIMAKNCKIDYIDVGDLLTVYY